MTDKPDFRTQPDEWMGWLNREKSRRYNANHNVVVEWGDELIAPPEFVGTWIEVKYIPYTGMSYDFRKESDIVISAKMVKQLIAELDNIFQLLFIDVGWCSPFIIEIDNQGLCHLLLCDGKNDKPKSMDMMVRTGSKHTIKIGG